MAATILCIDTDGWSMLRLASAPEHFAHPVSSLAHLGLGSVLAEQNVLKEALAQLDRALVLSLPDGFFGVDLPSP